MAQHLVSRHPPPLLLGYGQHHHQQQQQQQHQQQQHLGRGLGRCSSGGAQRARHNVGGAAAAGMAAAMVVAAAAEPSRSSQWAALWEKMERSWERVQKQPMEGVTFSKEEFEAALGKYEVSHGVGDVVTGTVFRTDKRGALVDIGGKSMAFLPLEMASVYRLRDLKDAGIVPGAQQEFEIVKEDAANDQLIVSLREIHIKLSWERCRQMQVEDAICKGMAVSSNRGGLTLQIECLRGFLPFSQLAAGINGEELMGRELPVKLLEVDEEQKRLVVSHRKALAGGQAALAIGAVVAGTVQTVKPYGAFVDIGGLTGLLHVSQISHERIANVEKVLQPGDLIKVMVLSHDRERGRISLSTKRLEPSPGDMVRNPALVYERADDMAMTFRQRVAQAEAAARAQDLQFQAAGSSPLGGLLAGIEPGSPEPAAEPAPSPEPAATDGTADVLSSL